MNAIFADTFFWIAFTNVQDQAHERAKSFARSAPTSTICTTEEVLTEYLNYFAGWGLKLRDKAALNVQSILEKPDCSCHRTNLGFVSGRANALSCTPRQRL